MQIEISLPHLQHRIAKIYICRICDKRVTIKHEKAHYLATLS
jgi:hypothetical protein